MNSKIERNPAGSSLEENKETGEPTVIGGGLSGLEIKKIKTQVDTTGKCCEGGSEGWTG